MAEIRFRTTRGEPRWRKRWHAGMTNFVPAPSFSAPPFVRRADADLPAEEPEQKRRTFAWLPPFVPAPVFTAPPFVRRAVEPPVAEPDPEPGVVVWIEAPTVPTSLIPWVARRAPELVPAEELADRRAARYIPAFQVPSPTTPIPFFRRVWFAELEVEAAPARRPMGWLGPQFIPPASFAPPPFFRRAEADPAEAAPERPWRPLPWISPQQLVTIVSGPTIVRYAQLGQAGACKAQLG